MRVPFPLLSFAFGFGVQASSSSSSINDCKNYNFKKDACTLEAECEGKNSTINLDDCMALYLVEDANDASSTEPFLFYKGFVGWNDKKLKQLDV